MCKTLLGCGLVMLLLGGMWTITGETLEHSSGGALQPDKSSVALSLGSASADPTRQGAGRPLCGFAASPFVAADACPKADSSVKTIDAEHMEGRIKPIQGEQVEMALRGAESGSAPALSLYVNLRSQCLEQAYERNGLVCFTNESLAALDARFLQTAGQFAQAGNADAQLAMVTWWRLRAYQLLAADPVASKLEWDEPEEKLVARVMGNSQFADAMRKSRDMYERLAANDPAKLKDSEFLEEYTRYGVVAGTPSVR
jgi:hypothetical protein